MKYEILDTIYSKKFSKEINSFENRFFNEDLRYDVEYFNEWLQSNSFINNVAVSEKNEVVASCSFLITNELSYVKFKDGKIMEFELIPSKISAQNHVYIYYCSLVCIDSQLTKGIIESAFNALKEVIESKDLLIEGVFSVGCTKSGISHLQKNGFIHHGDFYLDKYPIYVLDITKEQQLCWKDLKAFYNLTKDKERLNSA